jgi:type I restriction enzyme M protein
MTEDEKESDVLNDSNDAFVAKEVTRKLRELHADAETVELIDFKNKLIRVDELIKEEKELKAQIKKDSSDLHSLTKTTIENLSDKQVYELLEKKWIESLVANLHSLPDTVVDSLVNKIQAMQNKYDITFFEVEMQIKETESLLCSMIDELMGDEFDMKGLSEFKTLLGG